MNHKFRKIVLAGIIVILLCGIGIYCLLPDTAVKLLVKTERAVAGLVQRRIQAAALDFVYLEGGQGEPLVLLHGFGANKDHWTRIGRYLTPRFRVIAPDLTGFGESSPAPDGDYTIRAQVGRLKAFAHAMGLGSFHLGEAGQGTARIRR
jgi:hypothetical protein